MAFKCCCVLPINAQENCLLRFVRARFFLFSLVCFFSLNQSFVAVVFLLLSLLLCAKCNFVLQRNKFKRKENNKNNKLREKCSPKNSNEQILWQTFFFLSLFFLANFKFCAFRKSITRRAKFKYFKLNAKTKREAEKKQQILFSCSKLFSKTKFFG